MAKWCSDTILELMLDYIRDNANRLCVCSAQPTTFAEATRVAASSGVMLAMSSTNSISSATIGNGAGSNGRKVTIPENMANSSALYISDDGSATHIALVDWVSASSGTLMYITTCTPQSLTATGNVTVPAWGITLQDPS